MSSFIFLIPVLFVAIYQFTFHILVICESTHCYQSCKRFLPLLILRTEFRVCWLSLFHMFLFFFLLYLSFCFIHLIYGSFLDMKVCYFFKHFSFLIYKFPSKHFLPLVCFCHLLIITQFKIFYIIFNSKDTVMLKK